jgi:hypothetical protein
MKESRSNSKKKAKKPGPKSWTQVKKRPHSRGHKEPPPSKGDVDTLRAERLSPIIRRAHELYARGFFLHEVAQLLADEFGIKPPSEASVSRWFHEAQQAYLQDIKGFRQMFTFRIVDQTSSMLRKWLPIATSNNMECNRLRMKDGEPEIIVDENAIDEQKKAADVVIKTHAIQIEILGLKAGGAIEADEGKEKTIADLYAFINKMAARAVTGQPPSPEDTAVVLELDSGFEFDKEAVQ